MMDDGYDGYGIRGVIDFGYEKSIEDKTGYIL